MVFPQQYIIYLILAFGAVLITFVVSLHVVRQRTAMTWALLHVLWVASGWLIFNSLELIATSPTFTLFWAKASYVFIPYTPVVWLLFALHYTGRYDWLRRRRVWIFFVVPVLTTLLAWTTEWHGLIWQSYTFIPVGRLLAMSVEHGPAFMLHGIHSYTLVLLGSYLILIQSLKTYRLYRSQSIWLTVGTMIPVLLNLIYIFHLVPQLRKDYTAVGFACAGLTFVIGIYRYRLFDLKPVARDKLIDSMADLMLVLDRQGRVIDLNKAALEFLAEPVDDLIGQPVEVVLSRWKALIERFRHEFNTRAEITLQHQGRTYDYDLSMTPLTDAAGNHTGRLVVLRNIDTQKQIERELNQRTAQLEAHNQELNAFAHTVAHDLKTPLTTIVGFAELLCTLCEDEEQVEIAASIAQSGHKMYAIIEGLMLLARARQQEISLEPLNMHAIVEEALSQLNTKSASIVRPTAWPIVVGYAPWVEAVWVNYISNALKYGGTPPLIELGAAPLEDATGQVTFVRFWVRDNGPGIPLEKQAQLFTLFTRLEKSRAQGHGLGLSIVERIVKRLGGEVGLDSRPGAGSTFWFTLPAVNSIQGWTMSGTPEAAPSTAHPTAFSAPPH